jgi:hypothetical protein
VPGELVAQVAPLGGDPDRAGVAVAGPGHDAALGEQRRGAERVLVGAEQRGEQHVVAGLEAAVDPQLDPAAQAVVPQRLLDLGEPELPRQPGVLDRRQRRRAGAAVVARDVDRVGQRLDHPGGDGADAGLGDELDVDLASGLTCLRSKISWARSSIE